MFTSHGFLERGRNFYGINDNDKILMSIRKIVMVEIFRDRTFNIIIFPFSTQWGGKSSVTLTSSLLPSRILTSKSGNYSCFGVKVLSSLMFFAKEFVFLSLTIGWFDPICGDIITWILT